MKNKVVIIGGGVIGLTNAYYLLKKGFEVSVYSKKFGVETTSAVAGALWELPPAVCGYYETDTQDLLPQLEDWSEFSYRIFSIQEKSGNSGVYFRTVAFYSDISLEEDAITSQKIKRLSSFVRGISAEYAPRRVGEVNYYSYQYSAPMIDMDVYLKKLLTDVESMGGNLCNHHFNTPIHEFAPNLIKQEKAGFLINCSGLGARELANDDKVYPILGAWFGFQNEANDIKVSKACCTSLHMDGKKDNFVFIVPRGERKFIVGGIALLNTDTISPDDERVINMFSESKSFLPELVNLRIEDKIDFRTGLRPFRKEAIRAEFDSDLPNIIHCYGHGGSGVLLSWGSANHIYKLIKSAIK